MDVSAELAQQLKESGLTWTPQRHDFFIVPDTAVADRTFVLADMLVTTEILQGHRAITFNGATEWALDYVLLFEALWIPTEAQVRERLQAALAEGGSFGLRFENGQYTCTLTLAEEPLQFVDAVAANAYGKALLNLLQRV